MENPFVYDNELVKAQLSNYLSTANLAKLNYRRGMEEVLRNAFNHYSPKYDLATTAAQRNQIKGALRNAYFSMAQENDTVYTISTCNGAENLKFVFDTLMSRIQDLK